MEDFMSNQSISQKLLYLVSDLNFARIDSLAKRPNLFDIVGRTFTETWHSMFLGWLLDPKGSHKLHDYPLKRFLVAVSNPTIFGENADFEAISKIAAICDLSKAEVLPGQENKKEYQVNGVGRFDVFVKINDEENNLKVIILIEQKVNEPVNKNQCEKYSNWVMTNFPEYTLIPVLLAPGNTMSISSEQTIGSSDWFGIDYQILHDIVLTPIMRHPDLNSQVSILLEQYIDVLKIPHNGRKLAVTDEEKELALELYDKHREAFEAIQAALSDVTDISLVPITSNQTELVLYANGTKIEGNTVPEFFQKGLEFIVQNKKNELEQLIPFATSSKRYLIAKEEKHPNGNSFVTPLNYGGYYIEASKSRENAIKALAKILKELGVEAKLK